MHGPARLDVSRVSIIDGHIGERGRQGEEARNGGDEGRKGRSFTSDIRLKETPGGRRMRL